MALYEQGPLTQWTAWNANVIPFDTFGVAVNFFLNRTPLTTRLPKLPVGSPTFYITKDAYRARVVTTTAAFADTSGTVLTVGDSSQFDLGDVVLIESEYMLITATASGTTLTVTRGYAGSTAATHSTSLPALIVTNTRTGAEININSMERLPATVTQYCQTVQHAYSVGGALQADTNYVSGFGTPIERERLLAMQHTVDDFESGIYYGQGVPLAATSTRPMMVGLKNLITTNNTTTPTNATAYKPQDLIRDTTQKCFNSGGNPSMFFVSTDFMGGLATWGLAVQRVYAGQDGYGVPINLFYVPFLGGLNLVPCPLLQAGTVICLSMPEVRLRLKRPMIDKPRGSRGDAVEGDIIMEGAIELDNESHHAFVSGITGFAAA